MTNSEFFKLPQAAPFPGQVDRPPRFESHALVEVRSRFWNPFSRSSAVLLDISWKGFKIEFPTPPKLRPGLSLVLVVPLAPFNVLSPARVKLRIVLKWFDAQAGRAGGIFERLGAEETFVLEKIITRLARGDVSK